MFGGLGSRSHEPRNNSKEGLWEEQAKRGQIRQDVRLGREWVYEYIREEYKIKGKGSETQVLRLVARREGSLEHTEGTDLTCRGDLFCILLKI